eukprot:s3911_g7.t1
MTSPAAMINHESGGAAYSVVAMIMFQFGRLSFHFLTTASSKSIEALGTQLVHLLPQTGEGCKSVQLRGFLSFKGNVPLDLLGKVSLLLIATPAEKRPPPQPVIRRGPMLKSATASAAAPPPPDLDASFESFLQDLL